MTRWFMAVFFSLITSNCLFAQPNNLEIKGSGGNLFVEHKVAPKESFYSIARLYNVDPKELASYNHLRFENGLNIGQDLKIPLDKNNFTQKESAARGEALVPVYHTVEPKETLYHLGVTFNKVPVSSIKAWNHLPSNELSAGSPMIVGFLKVDKNLSSFASQTSTVAVAHQKEEPAEKKNEVPSPVTAAAQEPQAQKIEKKETAIPPAEPKIVATNASTKSTIDFSGGYFKKLYDQQIEKKSPFYATGSAGVFKSTSGWQDGKYYCFNNDAAPGTVLKVTDNATGKIVYAKVLDAIPDIKQNDGLTVIISNAAADELGASENKIDCALSYVK